MLSSGVLLQLQLLGQFLHPEKIGDKMGVVISLTYIYEGNQADLGQ